MEETGSSGWACMKGSAGCVIDRSSNPNPCYPTVTVSSVHHSHMQVSRCDHRICQRPKLIWLNFWSFMVVPEDASRRTGNDSLNTLRFNSRAPSRRIRTRSDFYQRTATGRTMDSTSRPTTNLEASKISTRIMKHSPSSLEKIGTKWHVRPDYDIDRIISACARVRSVSELARRNVLELEIRRIASAAEFSKW